MKPPEQLWEFKPPGDGLSGEVGTRGAAGALVFTATIAIAVEREYWRWNESASGHRTSARVLLGVVLHESPQFAGVPVINAVCKT